MIELTINKTMFLNTKCCIEGTKMRLFLKYCSPIHFIISKFYLKALDNMFSYVFRKRVYLLPKLAVRLLKRLRIIFVCIVCVNIMVLFWDLSSLTYY